MRYTSSRGSWLLGLVFALGVCVGLAAEPAWKFSVSAFYSDEFGKLTYRCDHAMREHMIAKQSLGISPSEEGVAVLRQAELGLLDCQDYDLLRKKLITLGLSENELSALSLRAIEERATALRQVVETHEIRY